MPADIRELRTDDVETALDFARAAGSQLNRPTLAPELSLIATDDQAVVGVLLGWQDATRRHRFELCLKDDQDAPLAKALIDTALVKMRSRQIHTPRFTWPDGSDPMPLLTQAVWVPQDLGQAA